MLSLLLAIVVFGPGAPVVVARTPLLHSDAVYGIRSQGSSDEMQGITVKSRGSKDFSSPLDLNGHERSSSNDDHTVVEDSQPVADRIEPVHLTTESSPFFLAHHNKYYVNSPYQYGSDTQTDMINDQRLEHSSNHVNVVPKWNRY